MLNPVRKALIYATSPRGLLVFDEPDFPEVPPQVPGGTVEPGEEVSAAAQREFCEETGLSPAAPFVHLSTVPYTDIHSHPPRRLERSYFHTAIAEPTPVEWIHIEQTPSGGREPVRFRLHWIPIDQAAIRLGLGMGACTHLIPRV